ncbi:putative permease [Gottschalkia purinilytica]|uniref:Putative permease n=1 Tax=Gottschalkia purinilytica TaxID=1503 RepID=A0A0L0W7X2_GOTPU|nr:permease [Gottschalkia purinilytica]KNF07536.1 putative permease [Gottschalkia purinilytica]
MSSIILYIISLFLLFLSFIKDKNKTKKALNISLESFLNLLPTILPMIMFVSIFLSIIDPNIITKLIGTKSGLKGVLLSIVIGSISYIPNFISLPLGASLLQRGAGYPQVAGLISTLMGIGIVTFPLESKYFDNKFSIIRNLIGLISCIVFVIIVWWFLI